MKGSFDDHWRSRAVSGDAEALRLMADAMLAPLFRFCYYRAGRDRHRCEEIVQQTLLTAIERIEQYEPGRAGNDIFGWLAGLARNEIHRALARDRHLTFLEDVWSNVDRDLGQVLSHLDAKALPEEVLAREETRQMVNAAMSQLPTSYRETLEAKYLQGRSVREMAGQWSTTEKAVESRLSRARMAFRETFLSLNRNLDLGAIF